MHIHSSINLFKNTAKNLSSLTNKNAQKIATQNKISFCGDIKNKAANNFITSAKKIFNKALTLIKDYTNKNKIDLNSSYADIRRVLSIKTKNGIKIYKNKRSGKIIKTIKQIGKTKITKDAAGKTIKKQRGNLLIQIKKDGTKIYKEKTSQKVLKIKKKDTVVKYLENGRKIFEKPNKWATLETLPNGKKLMVKPNKMILLDKQGRKIKEKIGNNIIKYRPDGTIKTIRQNDKIDLYNTKGKFKKSIYYKEGKKYTIIPKENKGFYEYLDDKLVRIKKYNHDLYNPGAHIEYLPNGKKYFYESNGTRIIRDNTGKIIDAISPYNGYTLTIKPNGKRKLRHWKEIIYLEKRAKMIQTFRDIRLKSKTPFNTGNIEDFKIKGKATLSKREHYIKVLRRYFKINDAIKQKQIKDMNSFIY